MLGKKIYPALECTILGEKSSSRLEHRQNLLLLVTYLGFSEKMYWSKCGQFLSPWLGFIMTRQNFSQVKNKPEGSFMVVGSHWVVMWILTAAVGHRCLLVEPGLLNPCPWNLAEPGGCVQLRLQVGLYDSTAKGTISLEGNFNYCNHCVCWGHEFI